MTEPTVQVPVSLATRLLEGRETVADLRNLRALLSQPNPTAEPFRPAPVGWFTFGSHADFEGRMEFSDETGEDGLPLWERHPVSPTAAPPSIADMAPGTEDVFQKEVWCFMCPAPSCRLTEYGFVDRQDADNALRDHLAECHD